MKRSWYLVLSLMAMLALLASACNATPAPETQTPAPTTEAPIDDDWGRIQAAGKMVVGTSADYPPFEFINEQNDFDGFDMVVIREVGKRLGLEIELKDISFDGLIAALKGNQIDGIIAAMSATAERDKEVDFTMNYYVGTDAILVKEGSTLVINTAEDMAGKKIGVQAGTLHETWVQDNLVAAGKSQEADISRYERAELAIADLKNGRVEVVAMDYFAAKAYVAQGGVTMALEQNLSGENMAIAVREGSSRLQEQLDTVIQQMWDDGTISQMAETYLGGEVIEEEADPEVTDAEWEAIVAAGKMVIGTSADYPPFEFINEQNDFDGFDMIIIREIGKRLGLEIELKDISFDGLIAALKGNQIDGIIAAMSATAERDKEVDFTINYHIGTDAILVKEGSTLVINTADDMAGKKIGVQAGTLHETWVQDNLVAAGKSQDADISRYERAELAIADLKNGRVDVVAMDYYAAKAYIAQGGITMALEQNLAGENMAVAVREGAAGLQWHLNQVIQEMLDDGFIEQVADQYLGAIE
ncbi:MAG: ABC transporter substrate-binding protein [Anaerolineae bacterium]|jgi:polar amino acid transport system substrate-binding protein|nr:ABC transporter substrate-binding protein [Anaerolineae bacterium]